MIKKIISAAIIILLVFLFFIVYNKACKITYAHRLQNENTKVKKKMPLFEFEKLDGSIFTKYDLQKGKSTIIVYFDPDCGLCDKTGKFFNLFHKAYNNCGVLFISSNSNELILNYRERLELGHIPNIEFLKCSPGQFYNFFKESNLPTYLIYDKNNELIKVINDDVPVSIILKYIKVAQDGSL